MPVLIPSLCLPLSPVSAVLILPLRAFGHSMYGVARSAFGQPAPAAKDDDA